MKLSVERLRQLRACPEQVAVFVELFSSEIDVTEELAVEHLDTFDWNWAAEHLLTAPAWAEYERVTAPAWAEYERVRACTFARLYGKGDA